MFRLFKIGFFLIAILFNGFAHAQTTSATETSSLASAPATMFRSLSNTSSSETPMYDPLDGSSLGLPNISGYDQGFCNLAAYLSAGNNYIGYSSGSQIPNSGWIQFYVNLNGYYQAYNSVNWVLTQIAFGGAPTGSIQLMLSSNNSLIFSQWAGWQGRWNYMYTQALPLNQWVKVNMTYGNPYGMYLWIDDVLAVSDPSRKLAIPGNSVFFGYSNGAFKGRIDEIFANSFPGVKILSPAANTSFQANEEIILKAIGVNLTWFLDNNVIGNGSVLTASLPPGRHDLSVSGTNGIGLPDSDSVSVSVADTPPEEEPEILSLTTSGKLAIGTNDSCSGIDFTATTSGPTTVHFVFNGREIGSAATDENNIARFFWLPRGSTYDKGEYEMIARNEVNSKSATFRIYRYKWDVFYSDPRSWRSGVFFRSSFLPPMTDKQWALAQNNMTNWPSADENNNAGNDESADESDKYPSNNLFEEPAAETCSISYGNIMETSPNGNSNPVSVSDPVNIVFGNYLLKEEDLVLKSTAPIVVPRFYNSLNFDDGPFGRGWTSSFFTHLEIELPRVVFHNSNGSRLVFNLENNSFIPETLTELTLTYLEGSDWWQISHPRGETWTFDQNGKILRMSVNCCGAAANALSFVYSTDGCLEKVSNPYGQWLEFTFSSEGRVSEIKDSSNRKLKYDYDVTGNLVSFKGPSNLETSYFYNLNGFMTEINRPGNRNYKISYEGSRVASLTDSSGNISRFSWDLEARIMTLTDAAERSHIYSFDENWQLMKYSVPAQNLEKEFIFSNGLLASLKDANGHNTIMTYNSRGLISSITDAAGHKIDYTYHPELNRLTGKTDSLGRTWSYTWCQRGNLTAITLPDGNAIRFEYDQFNNRIKKVDQLGRITRRIYSSGRMTQKIYPDGSTYTFAYDDNGNLVSRIDPLNRETKYFYDEQNRVVKRISPDGSYLDLTYDTAGNLTCQKDNLNRQSIYTYDSSGNPESIVWPDGTRTLFEYNSLNQRVSATDTLNRVYRYEYDLHNHITRIEYPDSSFVSFAYDNENNLLSKTDEIGLISRYEYDPTGRLLAFIDPAGSRWENKYDLAGRKIAIKDPLERITHFEHDVLDRVVKTVAPDTTFSIADYDAVGNLLVSTNALNQQTVYEYDALNRQVKTTRPNGAQFTTLYDAAGQVISETDALGNSTLYSYDFAGRRISAANALNHVWQYAYDNAGRLIRTVDPMGGVATMTYDLMDRVVTESDALGRVNAYEYDLTGKRIARTDAMGRRSIFAYDLRDRLTTEVDGEGRIVSYGYDAAGRKTRLTDGAGRVWRWAYDSLGRVTAETDPLGNQVKSSYDAVGNLALKTNARAQATAYEYDLMNRLVKVNYPDSTTATFSYDALGREVIRSGAAETVEKAYDVAGNLISERFVKQNKGWSYSFDLMGNRVQAVSPENETFKYKYDNLYRLIELESGKASEKIIYAYDALGRNIEEKRVDSTTANTFDAAGQLLEMKHYKLVVDHEAHGCGKEKNKKKEPTYKEEILALREYSYDPAGNRISMTDENGKVTAYYYDSSNWLTQVVYPNNDVVTYAYNDAGDRIREKLNDEPVVDYSYDSAGRMLSKGDESFSYDADGNMLTDALATYTWNSDNRLVKVEKNINGCKHDKFRKGHGFGHLKHGKEAVVYEEYTYLPMDWRRVTRKAGKYSFKTDRKGNARKDDESAQTFVSIYDGEDESHEYLFTEVKFKFHGKCKPRKTDLKIFREFVGGPAVDDIEHTRYNRLSLAMLKDGLGSTIALTGRDGKAIARIGYDAWGNFRWDDKDNHAPCKEDDFDSYLERLENTWGFGRGNHNGWAFGRHFGSKLTPYLHTGRRYSSLTSQYFNRNRYYSPALGRFISKDPIGFNGGYNLWGYCDNNPINYIDPFGFKWFLTWGPYVQTDKDYSMTTLPSAIWPFSTSNYYLERTDYYNYTWNWIPDPSDPSSTCGKLPPPVTSINPRYFTKVSISYWRWKVGKSDTVIDPSDSALAYRGDPFEVLAARRDITPTTPPLP